MNSDDDTGCYASRPEAYDLYRNSLNRVWGVMYSRADRLLRQFSLKLNADSIVFDENRLCSFIIDNRYRILLTSTNSEYIMIYGFAEDLRIIIILLLNFSMLIYGLQRIMDHICVMIITHNHYYWLSTSH